MAVIQKTHLCAVYEADVQPMYKKNKITTIFLPKTLVVEAAVLVVGATGVAAGAAGVALPPKTDF